MKRKRGHKKGKPKKPSTVDAVENLEINTEDNSVFDDPDDAQLESKMDFDVPASVVPQPTARVKVKLKSSTLLESQCAYSDAQVQSDTDKSSTYMCGEKQSDSVDKADDSPNSLLETQTAVSGKTTRKAGTIKIRSSRGLGSATSVSTINLARSPIQMQSEKNTQTASGNDKIADSFRESQQKKRKLSVRDSRYNEQELKAALKVIKKVMKMDAAEPFNVPVDPDALGIPDYFEVIETPMDFGTICNNLELGNIYMNSQDVYRDVEYIWDNCNRYNNKGDYVVDLMKRVKKNFSKYWMAAGLYIDQPRRTNDVALDQDSRIELSPEEHTGRDKTPEISGRKADTKMSKQDNVGAQGLYGSESIKMENVAPAIQEKQPVKSTPSKYKSRRRHGISHHKSTCLCAVCVVRRRRKEREGNSQMVENQIEISDGNLSQDLRQEETVGNPFSEDASSNLDHSPDPGVEAGMEERPEQQNRLSQVKHNISENEVEIQNKDEVEPSEQLQIGDGSGEQPNPLSGFQEMEDSGFVIPLESQKDDPSLEQKEETATAEQLQKKQEELKERHRQTEMYKNLLNDENPSLIKLCGTLFSDNPKSFWSGPHSLARRNAPVRSGNAIHAAVAMFMK